MGALTVVGIGFKFAGHVTVETRAHIKHADKVFVVLPDAAAMVWAAELNPTAEPLPLQSASDPPIATYQAWTEVIDAWVERILTPVRQGFQVCMILHGHPGVGVYPIHEMLRRTRLEGYPALMLPGLSAADCLFADLGVDPLEHGCQLFEATDFLLRRYAFSRASALLLWQVGIIGEFGQQQGCINRRGVRVLVEVLEACYGADHEVVVYEAALYPIVEPVIQRVPLARLPEAQITERSILYVPPGLPPSIDASMLARLCISPSRVQN